MGRSVSSGQLAAALGISDRQVRNLVKNGVLSAEKDEKNRYRFDLDAAMDEYQRYAAASSRIPLDRAIPTGKRKASGGVPREFEALREEDSILQEEWFRRVELFEALRAIESALFDGAGSFSVSEPAQAREIIRGAFLDLQERIHDGHPEAFRYQNRYLCPRHARARLGVECPNGGKCFKESAIAGCLAASTRSDFIQDDGKAPLCCFCGEELPIRDYDGWLYVAGDTPFPKVAEGGALCCLKCANERLDRRFMISGG